MSIKGLMGQVRTIRDVFSQGVIKVLQRVGHSVHVDSVHGLRVSFVQDGDMCCKVVLELFEPFCILIYGLQHSECGD